MSARRWSTVRLSLAFYPLAAGAMAVNLFFTSLIGSWIGGPVLDPWAAVSGGMAIGAPVAFAFARHFRNLMDASEPRT